MDPAFIDSAGDVQFLLQLYAGLTRLDEEGRAVCLARRIVVAQR